VPLGKSETSPVNLTVVFARTKSLSSAETDNFEEQLTVKSFHRFSGSLSESQDLINMKDVIGA
jgi:hypothetical protein